MLARLARRAHSRGAVALGFALVLLLGGGLAFASSGTARGSGASTNGLAVGPPSVPADRASLGRAALVKRGQLWVSDSSGQFRSIALAPDGGQLRDPAWRPTGDGVAYTRVEPKASPSTSNGSPELPTSTEIWLGNVRGDATPLLRDEGDGTGVGQPAWSPDGGSLLFVRELPFRSGGVAGVTRRIERLDLATGRRDVVADGGTSPAVAPGGRLVAYVVLDATGASDLWVADLATGDKRKLTDRQFVDISSPRFSADGETIAFGGAQVAAQNSAAESPGAPGWKTLATWLAPAALAHEYLSGLWLIEVDGQKLRPAANDFYDAPVVRWLSDPLQIFLYDEDGLFLVDLPTRRRHIVIAGGDYLGFDWLANSPAP